MVQGVKFWGSGFVRVWGRVWFKVHAVVLVSVLQACVATAERIAR